MVDNIFGALRTPVLSGLTIGHTADQLTLPYGVMATLDADAVQGLENRLLSLSEAIARRFFLRGGEPLRSTGMTLA